MSAVERPPVLAKILQRRKECVGGRRAKIEKALAALAKPLAVVPDDIDRLTTSEIRDIFKLVRLSAEPPERNVHRGLRPRSSEATFTQSIESPAVITSRRSCKWALTHPQCRRMS